MTKFETLLHTGSAHLHESMAPFAGGFLAGMTAALILEWLAGSIYARQVIEQLLPAGEKTVWYLSRASAVVAYLFLSGSVIWGLALSTKIVREWAAPPLALVWHNTCSWMAVGLATFHALVLLFDSYFSFSIADLLIPFTGPYRPQSVGLGIISLYGLLLIASSFRARKWLGQRNWRRIHYLSFVLFLLATAHGVTAGADTRTPALQVIYVGSALGVLFLVNYRLLTLPKRGAARPAHPMVKTGRSTQING